MNASLTLLARALALELVFGVAAALLGVGLDRWAQRQPLWGGLGKAVARLISWPWIALPLYLLGLVLLHRFAIVNQLLPVGVRSRTASALSIRAMVLPLLTLTGVTATFIATALYDAWRRGLWLAGLGAALAALGRALLALSSALVLVEIVVGGAWGGIAAALARWRGAWGESLADLLVLPAWIATLLPALVLALVLRSATLSSNQIVHHV